MTYHTPGPWNVADHVWDDPNDNGMNDDPIGIDSADGLTSVAEACGGLGYSEQSANANLIAAAPDLLAALRELIADVDAVGLDYADEEWSDLVSTYHRAVAALAKAEGKNS